MPAPEQTPLRADALQLSGEHIGSGPSAKAYGKLMASFGSLFPEGTRLWSRSHGSWHFASPSPDDTLLFPTTHAKAGQDRYTWRPHPTAAGVSIGTLVAD